MIKYNSNDISDWNLGDSNLIKVYRHNAICYYKVTNGTPTPTPVSSCYEVITTPITSYTATTYDSVYSWTDEKWYMKNNLNQYEEYGIFDVVEDISSATTYDGKLAVVGTTEYQYSGGSWSVVGTYEDDTTTYEITGEDPYEYEGAELSTTFKIPTADIEELGGWLDFTIRTQDGGRLTIGTTSYRYMGSSSKTGTVTNDNNYYYYELPDIDSVVIQQIQYWNSTPIHLIVGSKQVSVEYSEKTAPSSALTYSSIADMEAVSCPTVGVGQYCYTNGQVYKYTTNEQWESAQDSELMIKSFNANGEVGIMGCGYNNGEVKNGDFVSGATDIWLGSCITSVNNIWKGLYDTLSSMTISSTVPPTYSDNSSIPQYLEVKVPCNSVHSYRTSKGWNYLCNKITSDEPNCQTEINYKARLYGSDNALLTEIPRSSAIGGNMITSAETQSYASTTYSIEFGDCFNAINNGACRNFKMTNVTIPDSVTFIGQYAFSDCTGLTSCTIGSGVTSISNAAFMSCTSLTSCTIESGVASIGSSAFTQCNSLTSIDIPNSVRSIGSFAFYKCSSLTSIDIPSGLTSISSAMCYYCGSLTSIDIPSGVTSIGNQAFQSCSGLTSIDIPSRVTYIGRFSFYGCYGLSSVTIPSGVTSIGDYAFSNCTGLTSVTIPSGVTSIGNNAFEGCTSLTSITCNAVTPPTLGSYAFDSTNNCPIYVPSESVNAYKTASRWSNYASRIQAIP